MGLTAFLVNTASVMGNLCQIKLAYIIFKYINTTPCQSNKFLPYIEAWWSHLKRCFTGWWIELFQILYSIAKLISALFYLFFIINIRKCSSVVFMMKLTAYIGWFCFCMSVLTLSIMRGGYQFCAGIVFSFASCILFNMG